MQRVSHAAAAALIIGALGTTAASASAQSMGYSVTGTARSAYPTPAGPGSSDLTVSADSGLSGQDPGGDVTVNGTSGTPMGEFSGSGAVTCVRVSGNKVAIKYRFTQASGQAAMFQGGGVEIFIQDNGKPQGGQPVDATAFDPPQTAATFDPTASQCDDPNTAAYNKVESGDYTLTQTASTNPPGAGKGHHHKKKTHKTHKTHKAHKKHKAHTGHTHKAHAAPPKGDSDRDNDRD